MKIKKPKLIPRWRECWRWYSQHINMALVSVAPIWMTFPEDWRTKALETPGFVTGVIIVMSVLGALGFIGRIVDQGSAEKP